MIGEALSRLYDRAYAGVFIAEIALLLANGLWRHVLFEPGVADRNGFVRQSRGRRG